MPAGVTVMSFSARDASDFQFEQHVQIVQWDYASRVIVVLGSGDVWASRAVG